MFRVMCEGEGGSLGFELSWGQQVEEQEVGLLPDACYARRKGKTVKVVSSVCWAASEEGAASGTASVPRREWSRSVGGDHQCVGDADARGDQVHESELYGVQVSVDQGAPVAHGIPQADAAGGSGPGVEAAAVLAESAVQCVGSVRASVLR
jgi:hypothetical protein